MSVEFSLLFFVHKVWVTVGGWVGGKNSLLSRIRKGDFFKRLSCSLCKFFVIHIRERREPSTSPGVCPQIRLGLSVWGQEVWMGGGGLRSGSLRLW